MKLKDNLYSAVTVQIIKNVRTSSNDLVKRVLAEETTYRKESKKLMTCGEKEFYLQRDKLVDALNLYEHWEIGPPITETDKENLDYKLLHSELKEFKKKKLRLNLTSTGLSLGTVGLVALYGIGMAAGSVIVALPAFLGWVGGLSGSLIAFMERGCLSETFLSSHLALRSYIDILKKSKKADEFTHDIPSLEEMYPVEYYADSEMNKLYENNTKGFIDYFSSLKETEEKEEILRLLYNSEYKNEEIISWLDKNEPELVKKVGLNL